MPEVKLNRLESLLDDLTYPPTHDELLDACEGTVLVLAEGREPLADVIERSSEDTLGSVDEVLNEVLCLLPRHAVGEPYQSEGEGYQRRSVGRTSSVAEPRSWSATAAFPGPPSV